MANDQVAQNSCGNVLNDRDNNAFAEDETSSDLQGTRSAGDPRPRRSSVSQKSQAGVEDPGNHIKTRDQDSRKTSICVPSRRSMTKRGRYGKKWVSLNYERKEQLKAANNGIMPYSDALITSPFPHCGEWSEENLPKILFYIKPPKSHFEGQPVRMLMENGRPVTVGHNGNPLRDLPILPRRISLEVAGWLIEAWRRIDPRIRYSDILDRQIEDHELGLLKIDRNAFQNHCRRECRMVLGLWTSYDRREIPHRTDVEAIESLTHENVSLNTVLTLCPDHPHRLSKIRLTRRTQDGCGKYYAERREVDDTNVLDATFPIDHFVLKTQVFPNTSHSMDRSMLAAWELSIVLGERARIHGVSHWSKLTDACRPISWFDRTRKKRLENDAFDRGCSVCTWNPERDQTVHKQYMDEIAVSGRRASNNMSSEATVQRPQTLKRRKLKRARDQSVPAAPVVEVSAETCYCCEQAKSSKSTQLFPSKRFQKGDFRSFYRDNDDTDIEESDEAGDHENVLGKQEDTQGPLEQVSSTSSSTSLHPLGPSQLQIDPSLSRGITESRIISESGEASPRDLIGVGSHLAVRGEADFYAAGIPASGPVNFAEMWYPPYGGPTAGYVIQSNSIDSGLLQEINGDGNIGSSAPSTVSDLSDSLDHLPDLSSDIQAIFSSPGYLPVSGQPMHYPHALDERILPGNGNSRVMQSPEHIYADTHPGYGWGSSDAEPSSITWSFTNTSFPGTSLEVGGRSSLRDTPSISAGHASPPDINGVISGSLSPVSDTMTSTGYNNVDEGLLNLADSASNPNQVFGTASAYEQIDNVFHGSLAAGEPSAFRNGDPNEPTGTIVLGDDCAQHNDTRDGVLPGFDSTVGLC